MTWNKQYSYFNTKKVMSGGRSYDSKFEAGYGQELELRKKAGDIEGFDTHLRIPLEVNGYVVCDYYIDFAVYHKDGSTEYVETKGYMTDVFKLKWKLFCALFEDDEKYKLTLIMQGKQNAPKMRKSKK
jgi:hypothetical protein